MYTKDNNINTHFLENSRNPIGSNLGTHTQISWETFESYQSNLDLMGNKEQFSIGSEDEIKVIFKKVLANKDYTRIFFPGRKEQGAT